MHFFAAVYQIRSLPMRGKLFFVLFLAVATIAFGAEPKDNTAPRHVGERVAAFRLQDHLGSWHSLDEVDEGIVVVAFFGVECPLAKLYGPRLEELSKKYKQQGVVFLGINSNQQDTLTEIGHYARAHQISFPLLKDPGNAVADQFGAERTPEVFMLDEQRVVRYWGKIDDQYGVEYARAAPSRHHLAEAIDSLLAGKPAPEAEVEPVGCHIGRVVRAPAHGDVTYANQVSRVLQRRCVACHRPGGIGPFSLTSYEEAAAWAETAREVIHEERMPPWHANPKFGEFSNDARMPDEEKNLFYRWIENGVPEGNPAQLPPSPEFVEGWSIPEPDLIVEMPEPFVVPATGTVPYQYIVIDPGVTEDKWVQACEALPGNRAVVHHIAAFVQPPGTEFSPDRVGTGFETLGAYVPGIAPLVLPEGTARLLPAGAKIVLQMHYTPTGSPQTDQSRLGLVFAEPGSVRKTIQMGAAANFDLRVPPGAANHRVESSFRISHDTLLYSLTPHMHFRGKSFRYEAIYPNGTREVLLDVPRYDFNWQHVYRLTQPKLLPAGTLMHCIAHYDNSERNLSNPDPTIEVRWGEQTWEEMMIGYFEGTLLSQDLSLPKPQVTPAGGGEFEVLFSYRPDRAAKTVHLAGTFNEWSNSRNPLEGPNEQGRYETRIRLKPGTYNYKFVLDGEYWTHDPASSHLVGVLHESLLVVGEPGREQSANE
jgi:peroxiredoxin